MAVALEAGIRAAGTRGGSETIARKARRVAGRTRTVGGRRARGRLKRTATADDASETRASAEEIAGIAGSALGRSGSGARGAIRITHGSARRIRSNSNRARPAAVHMDAVVEAEVDLGHNLAGRNDRVQGCALRIVNCATVAQIWDGNRTGLVGGGAVLVTTRIPVLVGNAVGLVWKRQTEGGWCHSVAVAASEPKGHICACYGNGQQSGMETRNGEIIASVNSFARIDLQGAVHRAANLDVRF